MYPIVSPPVGDVGAIGFPRQLQRWLDVNPDTQLTRTSTTLTVPSFALGNGWNGYSDIVCSFNVEAPNNLALQGFQGNANTTPQLLQDHNPVYDVNGNYIQGV